MPLNFPEVVKFLKGKLKGLTKRETMQKHGRKCIRTDFVLQNAFCYLQRDGYFFSPMNAMNEREELVIEAGKEVLDCFKSFQVGNRKIFCMDVVDSITEDWSDEYLFAPFDDFIENRLNDILWYSFDEIFSDGINWNRIMQFFVFTGELSITCFSRNLPMCVAEKMFKFFSRLVKEKLRPWIKDHGGWEYIIDLAEHEKVPFCKKREKPCKKSWSGKFYHGIMIMGTLLHVANCIQFYSFP